MSIDIDNILAKLDPKTRARVQSAQDVQVEKQLTPSIGLNFALRGGLGYGRQVLVWGNKSAGKSSFCLQMIALAQKEGKTCAWIDAEASYDQSWAERLGVDSSSLIYSPAKTVNDMVDDNNEISLDLCMLVTSPQVAWQSSSFLPRSLSSGRLRLRLMLLKLGLKLATKSLSKESADQLTGLLITTNSVPQIYRDNTTFITKGKLLV